MYYMHNIIYNPPPPPMHQGAQRSSVVQYTTQSCTHEVVHNIALTNPDRQKNRQAYVQYLARSTRANPYPGLGGAHSYKKYWWVAR